MNKEKSFSSLSKFCINEHVSFFVNSNVDFKNGHSPLVGKRVEIDGDIYKVKNIETNCIKGIIKKGSVIGIQTTQLCNTKL